MAPTPPHNIKCPCCNNPWAAATGDMFAKICQECETTTTSEEDGKGLDRSNMDFEVHPKENFYQYANGSWLKNNPIPSGYPNWNSFLTLHVQSQENLKKILLELAKNNKDITDDERKVSVFYKAAMEEEAIKTAGVEPLQPLLEHCNKTVDALKEKNDQDAKCLGAMAFQYGISPFFCIGVSPDKKDNSEHSIIAEVAQGGIGLPDRDNFAFGS
jgi:putative endopeptidase